MIKIHPTAAIVSGLLLQLGLGGVYSQSAKAQSSCPSALERFSTHTVEADETLSGLAAEYGLRPATLTLFNPGITETLTEGSRLRVPPFNGTLVSATSGDSWQTLAKRHSSRADVLFEINGCQTTVPSQVFIPSANPAPTVARRTQPMQLSGYPLTQPSDIFLSYGWQPHASRDELVFNNGIAFSVPETTGVRSVAQGTVAYVGEREGYGKLLVINHDQGVQTRYGNLSDISVAVGQSVTTNAEVGSISGDGYLYFEVRTNSSNGWIAQDPGQYLPALELR
ncbi:MAG: M23 family metallopeptidase [Cyanobacteria bacterium P01_A01_bin.116]